MAWGYLTMLKLTGKKEYSEKAVKCLDWLIENKSPGYSDYSWGNHFKFSSRVGSIPKLEPIIPWSSLIGQAFLDAYETLENPKYLKVAESVCDWILKLPRKQTDSGVCIGYNALGESTVHGASMLGAALLARTAKFTGNKAAIQVAKEAMEYSCTRQNPDGSWYYAEEDNSKWIDNFHTGYNLDSLKCYIDNTDDRTYDDNLRRGFAYFKNTFFEENGRPKYYHNRTFPVDIQCASQAIDTLAYFSDIDETALELSEKVARWTIVNMQDKTGYFYYRQLSSIKVKTPMLHWGQATMYKSLSLLLSKMQ
jgi:rhamnogalacturonyl hydrolase YesR